MNLLTELERNVLGYRFGVDGKNMLCVGDIQNTLNIQTMIFEYIFEMF